MKVWFILRQGRAEHVTSHHNTQGSAQCKARELSVSRIFHVIFIFRPQSMAGIWNYRKRNCTKGRLLCIFVVITIFTVSQSPGSKTRDICTTPRPTFPLFPGWGEGAGGSFENQVPLLTRPHCSHGLWVSEQLPFFMLTPVLPVTAHQLWLGHSIHSRIKMHK